jgi:uncharacterized tellurite resistance protein B-like protein
MTTVPSPTSLPTTRSAAFSRYVLTELVSSKCPLDALEEFGDRSREILDSFAEKPAFAPGTLEVFLGGTLGWGSSFLLWLNHLGPHQVWLPVVGAFFGAAGLYRLIDGVEAKKADARRRELARIFLSCFKAIQNADNIITEPEKKVLKELLEAMYVDAEKLEDPTKFAPQALDQLVIPEWITDLDREYILQGSWALAYCDGIHEKEARTLEKIALLLDIAEDHFNQIKGTTMRALDDREQLITSVSTLIRLILPREHEKEALELLFPLTLKRCTFQEFTNSLPTLGASTGSLEKLPKKPPQVDKVLAMTDFLLSMTFQQKPAELEQTRAQLEKVCAEWQETKQYAELHQAVTKLWSKIP